MQNLLYLLLLLVIGSSSCTTLLLKDDFENRPNLLSNELLVNVIPGEPDGDRIQAVLPQVSMQVVAELDHRALVVQGGQVDYQLTEHDAFELYLVTWKGFQDLDSGAETMIDLLNEADETVLTIRLQAEDVVIISDYDGTAPRFSYNDNLAHSFAVTLHVKGTDGAASYADISVKETDGSSREWANMPLLTNISKLHKFRVRTSTSAPYAIDRIAVNAK